MDKDSFDVDKCGYRSDKGKWLLQVTKYPLT